MSPLQHLADTAANLNAQLCELHELREQVSKALNRRNQNSGLGTAQSHGQKWIVKLPSASIER
jgi:hypothetical protein